MTTAVRKIALLSAGILMIMLGIIGALLPFVPGMVFFLLGLKLLLTKSQMEQLRAAFIKK